MENLVLYETPELRSPYLVAGFKGWPNAGEVSTRTVGYLRDKLEEEYERKGGYRERIEPDDRKVEEIEEFLKREKEKEYNNGG